MTTFDDAQHPRGQAGNAGQFRAKKNSSPAGELGDDASADVVEVRIETSWMQNDHIPPRARKPRPTLLSAPVTVTIPSVSGDDAPVGFTVPQITLVQGDGGADMVSTTQDVRTIDGRLYAKVENPSADLANVIFYAAHNGSVHFGVHSEAEAERRAHEEANRFVLIDGEPWKVTGEPVYKISTFGLGHNHGGTSLASDLLHHPDFAVDPWNGHAASEWIFPADQHEQAIEAALELAEARGDTASLTMIRGTREIGLTGEFTPGSTFRPAPRLDYTPPSDLGWDAEQGEVRREFDRFKGQLLTVPGAIVEVDDGWGGTARTLNRTAITEKQAYDYDRYLSMTASTTTARA